MGSLGDSDIASPPVARAPAPASEPLRRRAYTNGRPAHLRGRSLSAPARSRGKRALDLAVALAVTPVVLPIGIVCAILVKLTSPGPALFRQERIGLGGKSFPMYKFRTMHADAEERLHSDPELWQRYVDNDYKLPAELDSRITAVGRLMRRSSLDELPQILNVLNGSMSMVGPRPVVPGEVEKYGSQRDVYLSARPGITGAWQVNGRSDVDYPDRVDLDVEYVREWSLWLDVKILVKTPKAVLSARGAF